MFLQGVCSPFFGRLADRLKADGHHFYRINFNAGDAAYWGNRPAWSFRKDAPALPEFLEAKFHSVKITDLVLFGDRRPVHQAAIDLAKRLGIRVHVFEEGYFRPFWVTLERGGVNAHSPLPRDPDWYRQVGATLPEYGDGTPFHSPFRVRATHDILYHLAGSTNPLLFPGYRTHAPWPAHVEYAGYLRRFSRQPYHERIDRKLLEKLALSEDPFYLLPLQLNSDAQIRDHSSFNDMTAVMAYVMVSFAAHAPGRAKLVIKNHPLDMGFVNYRRIIADLEQRFDLSGRVYYLETGDLMTLLKHASGVVTVNSTVGALALQQNCPTIALSDPVYSLPGLTFQGQLDAFWKNTVPPDAELFRCFRNTVIHTTQVNGGFYCRTGIAMAVKNAVGRLTADRSPLEELL